MVLLSDEPSNFDNPDYNMTRIINSLQNISPNGPNDANATGIFYGILPLGSATDAYQPIANATGGRLYNSADFKTDADGVLTDIITKLNAAVNAPYPVTIVLVLKSATCENGVPNELSATVTIGPDPLAGITVTFKVTSGPNQGETGASVTDATGKATWTFANNNGVTGSCTFKAGITYEGVETCDGNDASGGETGDPLTAACINCNSPISTTPFTTETTITATTAESCSPLTVTVTGEDCFRLHLEPSGALRKYDSPTCVATVSGSSIIIGSKCQVGDHVEWPVKAVNAAGQVATTMCSVIFRATRRLSQSNLRGSTL
jgi:hypothetical protein